jgi:hypothetical protein
VRRVGRLVPDGPFLRIVVVRLDVVGDVVAGLAQQRRIQADRRGQPDEAAHVLAARRLREHARDERRARGAADRAVRPRRPVAEAPRRERVEVRRRGVGVAIGAQLGAVVLARDPEDVGPCRLGGRRGHRHRGGDRIPGRERDTRGEPHDPGDSQPQRATPARAPTHNALVHRQASPGARSGRTGGPQTLQGSEIARPASTRTDGAARSRSGAFPQLPPHRRRKPQVGRHALDEPRQHVV